MEKLIKVNKTVGSYKISYSDNNLSVENYENNKLTGLAFRYYDKSIMFVNYDSKIMKDGKIYNYGILLDRIGLRIGMFSFEGKKIVDSYYANYLNPAYVNGSKTISIPNKDSKVIIGRDDVTFFSGDKAVKKIKHNINVEFPDFIKNIDEMKLVNSENKEIKRIDNVEYEKVLESKEMTLYLKYKIINNDSKKSIGKEITDTNSKKSVDKKVNIKILLMSGDEKLLFTISNFEYSSMECGDFVYYIDKKTVAFYQFPLDAMAFDFQYDNYLNLRFRFRNDGTIKIIDSSSMIIASKGKVQSYGYNEIFGNDKHIVNMADVTSNIKAEYKVVDAEEELSNLVGLEAAKKQIRRFKNTCIKAMENGFPINLHMMFLGNPGTGKTTFARLVADIFYKNGILPTNKYVEGSRDTLVGQYVGETEEKTNAAFQKAMGGVLFIDEAYSLYRPDTPNDFGNIAMAELIKLMEDYRGKICVIFAGYTKQMHDLLRINSGLKSRIQYEIQFDDYDKNELRELLDIYVKKDNYKISDEDAKSIIDFVDKKRNNPDFANAREVRTALEQITMIQAERTFKTDINDRNILKCDVMKYISENTTNNKTINAPTYKMIDKDYLKECSKLKLDLDKDYERIIEACIEIKVNDYEGTGSSSAFIISPDGYAITAAHSIKNAVSISARRRILDRLYNTVETYHKCYVCGYDRKNDIAIIKIENELDNKFPYLPLYLGDECLPIFTEVVVFGYPLGTSMYDNLSGFKGYISSIQSDEYNENIYNLDVIAMPGSSGACVIDKKTMKVIGIINGLRSSRGHGIPFGRPIQVIWKLLGGFGNE